MLPAFYAYNPAFEEPRFRGRSIEFGAEPLRGSACTSFADGLLISALQGLLRRLKHLEKTHGRSNEESLAPKARVPSFS